MHQLSIYLLGDFRIRLDDRAITRMFRTEKERALLAYLAVESDRPHSREHLGELFWPDRPEGVARTNLRQALSGVRKAIGDRDAQQPFLEVNDEHIQFKPHERFWLDTAAYAQRFQTAFHHAHASSLTCLSCAQLLGEAVDLYRQDFLEGIYLKESSEFQEWMHLHREQYERYLLMALDQLSEFYEFNGDYERAHAYAWQYVKRAPLEEKAHRRLMQLLALSGRRSAAIEQFHACRRALEHELGVQPSSETVELFEKIRSGAPLTVDEPANHAQVEHIRADHLPAPLTAFVGRKAELEWFASCLPNPSCRLITITGMAGCGKTRLVIEAAHRNAGLFPDGVRFVSLEEVTSPELLAPSMARTLGVTIRANNPLPGMVNHLQSKKMLLVLDYFDDMIEQTGLLLEILQRAPQVKIVLTSRQRLNFQAACLYALEGLPCPPADIQANEAVRNPSIELFLARAARSRPGFQVDQESLPYLLKICRLVGGNPLAIELAASRLRELDSRRLVRQLDQGLEALTTHLQDFPERHRSITAAIDPSWEALDEAQRAVFARLSIFEDSFTGEAAEVICSGAPHILAGLLERSLLKHLPTNRYCLPPLLKQYSQRRLQAQPEQFHALKEAYSRFYLGFLQERQAALADGKGRCQAVEEIQAELADIRAALEHASATGEYYLAASGREHLERFEAVRQAEQDSSLSAATPIISPLATIVIQAPADGDQLDALTGLPDKDAFLAALQESLSLAAHRGQPVAILILGIQGASSVMDDLGPQCYEALLDTLAKRLRGCMREKDLVARFGEAEFAFLLDDAPNSQNIAVVARKILSQLSSPVDIDGRAFRVQGRVGAGVYPGDGDQRQALIAHALEAMRSERALR